MKIKEILLELNVVNAEDIKLQISVQYDGFSPEIQSWFNKQFYRWVINNEKLAIPYNKNHYMRNKPNWIAKALAQGEKLSIVEFNTRVNAQAERILKWLFHIENNVDRESVKIMQKLPRLTVPEAIKRSNLHVKEMEQIAIDRVKQDKNYKVVMKFPDGYSIVKILSGECKDLEGDIMQNCIDRRYDTGKNIKLFSLRDPNNKAHVTIEVIGKYLIFVKGKQNRSPIPKYHPYITAFAKKFKIDTATNFKDKYGGLRADGSYWKDWKD